MRGRILDHRGLPHYDHRDVHAGRSPRARAYFTNADRPVFVLRNLPETVKGALFARYSRSAKSVRRLFLDEFLGEMGAAAEPSDAGVGSARADKLYARVLSEYGDDSVAQLGGAHIACEGVSNVLTKVLEWGRLMAYLEQSTATCRTPIAPAATGNTTYPRKSTLTAARDVRAHARSRLRSLRALDSGDGGAFPRQVSQVAR
jgi:Predicted alternative thymidylate synthase